METNGATRRSGVCDHCAMADRGAEFDGDVVGWSRVDELFLWILPVSGPIPYDEIGGARHGGFDVSVRLSNTGSISHPHHEFHYQGYVS